ncbi:MAG: hypothetical protein ACKVS6_11905 [Planctomycetota bacterium]
MFDPFIGFDIKTISCDGILVFVAIELTNWLRSQVAELFTSVSGELPVAVPVGPRTALKSIEYFLIAPLARLVHVRA